MAKFYESMPKIYANRVYFGKWTIEQVPERWRAETLVELAKMEESE